MEENITTTMDIDGRECWIWKLENQKTLELEVSYKGGGNWFFWSSSVFQVQDLTVVILAAMLG